MKDEERNKQQLLAEVDRLRQELARQRGAEAGHKRLHEAVIRRAEELDGLNALAVSVSSSLELQQVVDSGLESTVSALRGDSGIILLFDNVSDSFTPAAQVEISDDLLDAIVDFEMDKGLLGAVVTSGSAVEVTDLATNPDNLFPQAAAAGFSWCVAIPARARGVLRAVIIIFSKQPNVLGTEREELPEQVGRLLGMALANAQDYRQAQQEIVERMLVDREQARMNAQLQERSRVLSLVVESASVGLLLVGGSGTVIHANKAADTALQELGCAEQLTTIAGLPLDELLSKCCETPWVEVGTDQERYLVSATPLQSASDVSDESELWALVLRRPSEEASLSTGPPLPSTGLEVAELAGNLAKELNDTLSATGLYAAIANKRSDLPAAATRWFDSIGRLTDEATSLIDRLLDYGGKTMMEKRPIDLKATLEAFVARAKTLLAPTISVELTCPDDDCLVNADPLRLEQALMNLVFNSGDAMQEGGSFRLAMSRVSFAPGDDAPLAALVPGEWIRLAIKDSGQGIAPGDLAHACEPFFTTKRTQGAKGLGLSQSLGLITQHNGHFLITSTPGEGTLVQLFLPVLHLSRQQPEEASEYPEAEGNNQPVLAVEGDEILLSATSEGLKSLGFKPLEATTREEALQVVERWGDKLTAMLVDTELENDQAQPLVEELVARLPSVTLLLLVGHEGRNHLNLEEEVASSCARVRKPLTLDRLRSALAPFLRPKQETAAQEPAPAAAENPTAASSDTA